MTDAAQISEEDYLHLEEFISRTPRGRAFLRETTRRARAVATDELQVLIAEIKTMWAQHFAAQQSADRLEVLRRELQEMSASIANARREIAALKPKDGSNDRIISATSELDAIVTSTERASLEILNAAERIMTLAGRMRGDGLGPRDCDTLEAEVTTIFTACSFQDLTGQRTTKVVNALRYIEQRINTMIEIWGSTEGVKPSAAALEPQDKRPDAHLMHGPQPEGQAISQDEIDRLLNGGAPAEPAAPAPTPAAAAPAAPPPAPADAETEVSPLDQSAIDALFG